MRASWTISTGVADVADEHSLWFHIDGAYGGAAALFAPSVRARFAGFERADSFIVDPHKWLFAPFDCAALVYRRPNLAKAVHTQDAQYLEVLHSENPEEWNPSDYAFHLTRRARGLPLWFSLAVNGLDAYRDAVEAGLAIAQRAAERIAERPTWSWSASPGSPSCSSGGRDGPSRTTTPGRPACCTTRSASSPRPAGRARPWPASPSCTPTRPSRWSTRCSPQWPRRAQARRSRTPSVSTSWAPGTGQAPSIRK